MIKNDAIKKAVGIDLGTTYSCVGIWQNNTVQIIPNEEGNMVTPSYVAFTSTSKLVGGQAKNQIPNSPHNTIFGAKRLIGRKFNDAVVQKDIKLWPFKVQEGNDGKPVIVVEHKEQIKRFSPEQISSMILTRMKQITENYIGQTVDNAVITVPCYFNDSQRQATKHAGAIAGFNVLRIMNEPTAVVIAYGLHKKGKEQKNVLVFDLGGGKLDVSLIVIEDEVIEVKQIAGNTHLGGQDFDNKIVNYCVADFKTKYGLDLNSENNSRALRRLKIQCEKAKRILSSSVQTTIEIDSLTDSQDFSLTITRSKLQQLCLDLFKQAISYVDKVLNDSKISKDQIHQIVPVGGSTRIPKINELIKEYFNGKQLNKSINPDQVIAYGAAIQAAILIQPPKYGLGCVLNVTCLSLGIETAGGVMTVIIPRNSTIPTKKSQIFTTCIENQLEAHINIYEGQRYLPKDNIKIGQLHFQISKAPKGIPEIEISFEFDENDILTVQVKQKEGKEAKIIIPISNTVQKIVKMVQSADKSKEQDEEIQKIRQNEMFLEQNINYAIRRVNKKQNDIIINLYKNNQLSEDEVD